MESFVVTRQTFAIGKKDVFHLQLEYFYETRKVIITSSLPDWILDEHPFPELTLNDKPPYFDMNEVNQKLTEYAHVLKKDKVARQFFYSPLLLNERGEFHQGKSYHYRQMLSKFQSEKTAYTSVLAKPYSSLYLTYCFRNAICKGTNYIQIKHLKRKSFELLLREQHHIDEYTELYYTLKNFVEIKVTDLRANMPSFIAGLNGKGEVIIAFVKHSFQLAHE